MSPEPNSRESQESGEEPRRSSEPVTTVLRKVLSERDKLRQVEARIDQECHHIVQTLGGGRLRELLEETYTLATENPDVRFTDLSAAESEVLEILRLWGGSAESKRSLDELLAEAVRKTFTGLQRQRLKRILYTKLSSAETEQEMRLWAVANVSLDTFDPGENPFLLGAFQTTLVEQLDLAAQGAADLSKPVTPVDQDIEALLGRELAEKAARIPHLLGFLDLNEVAFEPEEIQEHAIRFFDWAQQAEALGRSRKVKQDRDRLIGESLEQLLTPEHRQRLVANLDQLKRRAHAGELPKEVADLAESAVTLLDRLPPGLHPLLQVLWLTSVERFVENI